MKVSRIIIVFSLAILILFQQYQVYSMGCETGLSDEFDGETGTAFIANQSNMYFLFSVEKSVLQCASELSEKVFRLDVISDFSFDAGNRPLWEFLSDLLYRKWVVCIESGLEKPDIVFPFHSFL
ncbi:MAG: hypothetical protein CVU05_10375 [Bacteroidetes bacterium HGW-Bacteroidetes-21]|jgi:hypothetical protein|nr:MAG: hypothetical protein CVU05_10375 [Bacteroidetes bacterium HGW-Bacteroidetes-21]